MSLPPSFSSILRDGALFLDIDGTLVDFSPSPWGVVVPPGLPALLHSLQRMLSGAMAFISGRRMADIESMFGGGIAAAAEHGALLCMADGSVITETAPDPDLARIAQDLRQAIIAYPGVLLEEKRYGLTLHWRAVPDMAQQARSVAEALLARYPTLAPLPAHQALEIRTRGTDKATALATFMRSAPFAGRRPVFIGDDITDEPAIARATAMGGLGLHVARDFGGCPQTVRAWLAEGVADAISSRS